jgi:sec-independent protein translocase protein TatB
MFDISWGEMMLIGAAALIFIGPKELPAALRALGQMTGKVRRMAGEFRSQFDEAMREADVQSIRKEFDSMNDAATSASTGSFNPIDTIRNEIKGAIEKPAAAKPAPDFDRAADLAPVEAKLSDPMPLVPPPEPAPAVDAASFDMKPEAPAPVTAAAPQPAPEPAVASVAAPRPVKDPA